MKSLNFDDISFVCHSSCRALTMIEVRKLMAVPVPRAKEMVSFLNLLNFLLLSSLINSEFS